MLPDGRVAYRLRKPRRNGATHLEMTPVELLAKIAPVRRARAGVLVEGERGARAGGDAA
jgi:hypothetical protein